MIGRVILYVLLPIALVLVLLIVLANRMQFETLRNAAEQRLTMQVARAALDIEMQNRNAVVSAQRMAEAQVAGMFGDRDASAEFAPCVARRSSVYGFLLWI